MKYKKKAHSVYLMTYHLVFVTKYRKPVISDAIGVFMKQLCCDICKEHGGELISAESDSDHLHLLISMPPQERPSDIIRVLKTQTSKKVHMDKELDKYVKQYLFVDTSLWSPSYFIATTGGVTLEKIKEYVESQRTEYHKRKYEKTGRYKKNKTGAYIRRTT